MLFNFENYTNTKINHDEYQALDTQNIITFFTCFLFFLSETLPFLQNIKSNGLLELFVNLFYKLIKHKINLPDKEWINNQIDNKKQINDNINDNNYFKNKNIVNISFDNIDTINLNLQKPINKITLSSN